MSTKYESYQAFAVFPFLPILGFALELVDMTALRNAVDDCERTVWSCQRQLESTQSEVQRLREAMQEAQAESARRSRKASELNDTLQGLSLEARSLDCTRRDLADLSVRINECLHTVNSALGSSSVIAASSSMRNMVTGVRGVVGALQANSMFDGPLAQLDEAALGALDRRVAAIKRSKLTL